MNNYELKGKRIIELEASRELVLEYFIICNTCADTKKPYYGIEIRKTENGDMEKEAVEGISYSKELVLELLDLMLTHIVTPISMVEIVDDYITERICS